MGGVVGVIEDVVTIVVTESQAFAEAVVAAGAQVLNDFLNVLAGPAAHDKVISEFSTQNSYLYNDDAYIDNLHNSDEIALNCLIKGTSFTDEIINFYKRANSTYDFDYNKAIKLIRDEGIDGDMDYVPAMPDINSNFTLIDSSSYVVSSFHEVLPSATLRINNTNLYEGEVPNEYNSSGSGFTWHSRLNSDGSYDTPIALDSSTFADVQTNTKNYLKYLGMPDPENLLDDLPYTRGVGGGSSATYSDVIDSVFLNFRVKWVSGTGSTTGNRISNKYLFLLVDRFYDIDYMPHVLTYDENDDEVWMFTYELLGDGYNYAMGFSHITLTAGNSSHANYQYDKDLICNDGYYYYDANKTLPVGNHSAQTVADVQDYLDANIGTSEEYANWLEIEENGTVVTIDGVDSVFPDEIYLPGSGITLKIQDPDDTSTYITADDQVLRVGNLYIKKSTTEIQFATVPASVYSNASIILGRSNKYGAYYYTVHNVSAIERITDYANETGGANTTFRYISHKLDASNNCVSAPILIDILDNLDQFEQHKLILASANVSMHMAYYLRIEPTWEQKLRAPTLNVIKVAAIVYTVISLGAASSLAALAEAAVIAYATSIAVNVIIENILVPIIVSNFGEDEALILLAVAAVAIAYYSRKSSTAGLDQFPKQAALFTTSVDIMNQMYTLAVVQPGIIEMQKEQDEWTATDNELTEKEEQYQENYEAIFGTEDSPSHLLNLQIRAALNPMPASAYINYHDTILERQFDCFDYDKYNELNVS